MKNFKNHFISIVLGSYIIFLLYLLTTGAIRKYINPRLSFLSVMALIILAAMLLFNFRKMNRRKPAHTAHDNYDTHDGVHCTCEHHHEEIFTKSSLILLLPMLLTLLIAPQTLSYQPANHTGANTQTNMIDDQAASSNQFNQGNPAPEYTEYNQLDIGDVVFGSDKTAKDKLVTTKVFLQGAVFRPKELKTDEAVLYRMVITCCAADGLPLGVLVKLPKNSRVKDGDWIGVEGTIQLLQYHYQFNNIEPLMNMVSLDKIYPYFTATRAYRTKMPADPYIFP
jgi:putative membrane protein